MLKYKENFKISSFPFTLFKNFQFPQLCQKKTDFVAEFKLDHCLTISVFLCQHFFYLIKILIFSKTSHFFHHQHLSKTLELSKLSQNLNNFLAKCQFCYCLTSKLIVIYSEISIFSKNCPLFPYLQL